MGGIRAILAALAVTALIVAACGPGAQDPGTDPGTQPQTQPGQQPGEQPGTTPATDDELEPGTDPATDPATDPGTQPAESPPADDEVGVTDEEEVSAAAATTWRGALVQFTDGSCVAMAAPIPGLEDPTTDPAPATPDPAAATPDPAAATPDPAAATPDPATGTPEPGTETEAGPQVTLELQFTQATTVGEMDPAQVTDPAEATPDPATGTPDPATGTPDPATDPATGTPDPATEGTPEPGTETPTDDQVGTGEFNLQLTLELERMPTDLEYPQGFPVGLLAMPPFMVQGGSATGTLDGQQVTSDSLHGYVATNMRSGFVVVSSDQGTLPINFLCPEIDHDGDGPDDVTPGDEPATEPDASPAIEPTPAASP